MDDRTRWNERYRGELGQKESPPDAFVVECLERLGAPAPGARALDVACGTGRHALSCAERGWQSHAWDVSDVALEIAARRAAERGLPLVTRAVDVVAPAPTPSISDPTQAANGAPRRVANPPTRPDPSYDLVLVVDFLDRDLLARLCELVVPGGHACVTTFALDYPGEHPSARFRMQPGELARGLPGFSSQLYRHAGGRECWLGHRGLE